MSLLKLHKTTKEITVAGEPIVLNYPKKKDVDKIVPQFLKIFKAKSKSEDILYQSLMPIIIDMLVMSCDEFKEIEQNEANEIAHNVILNTGGVVLSPVSKALFEIFGLNIGDTEVDENDDATFPPNESDGI